MYVHIYQTIKNRGYKVKYKIFFWSLSNTKLKGSAHVPLGNFILIYKFKFGLT